MEDDHVKRLRFASMGMLLLAAIFILILFFLPKTTTKTTDLEEDEIVYLTCNKSGTSKDYPLLLNEVIDDINYEVKIKFTNDSATEYSVTVSKEYDNTGDAESFVNKLQASFNIYVGERNISKEGLNPTYTFVDNVGKMFLSVKSNYLVYNNAPLLILGNDIVNKKELSDFESFFVKKGFTCNAK